MKVKDVIRRRIKERRTELGLSQADLAIKMQVMGHATLYPERIYGIETGRRRVQIHELIDFARVLRVPVSWLLGVPDFE